MTARLLQNGKQVFLDDNGDPLAAGEVFFYEPGTTIEKDTWQDKDKTTLNANPVLLDAAGRATIWGAGLYRQVVKDAEGTTLWDQIVGMLDLDKLYWAGVAGGTANSLILALKHGDELELVDGEVEAGTVIAFTAGADNTGAVDVKVTWTGGGESPTYNFLVNSPTGPVEMGAGELREDNLYFAVFDDNAGAFVSSSFRSVPDGNAVDDILIWDGTQWLPSQRFKTLEDAFAALSLLPDGNAVGDILVWDGSEWLPQQPAEEGGGVVEGSWTLAETQTAPDDFEFLGLAGASEILVLADLARVSGSQLLVQVSADNGANWEQAGDYIVEDSGSFSSASGFPLIPPTASLGISIYGYVHIFGNADGAPKSAAMFAGHDTGWSKNGMVRVNSPINAVRIVGVPNAGSVIKVLTKG